MLVTSCWFPHLLKTFSSQAGIEDVIRLYSVCLSVAVCRSNSDQAYDRHVGAGAPTWPTGAF